MPSQHKRNPLTLRLPEGLRARLEEYAERTGQPVNSVLTSAVAEKLDREDAAAADVGWHPASRTTEDA